VATHWHPEGFKILLEKRSNDGSWSPGLAQGPAAPGGARGFYATSSLADTCFAVLFLKRSGQPLPEIAKPKK
jgi:hypothetical protein